MEEKLVCIFPHSDDEFADKKKLQEWLLNDFVNGNEPGRYLLRKIGFKDKDFILRVTPGSLILFRKGENIVGEGTVKSGINRIEPPIDETYYNEIYIQPESIRTNELSVKDVEAWCKRTKFATNFTNFNSNTARFYLIIGTRTGFEQEFLFRFPIGENTNRNRRDLQDDGDWTTGDSIAEGFPPDVNSIPGRRSNRCYPTLMVAIGSLDNLEARILEAAYHVNVSCSGKNMQVIFEAAKWDSETWKKHSSKFNSVRVSLKIKGAYNEIKL